MMKKYMLLLGAIVFGAVSIAFAQDKIDKYCQVTVAPKNRFTSKKAARTSFSENKTLFSPKDTSLYQKLKDVNNLTTEADVLNYMTGLGWTVINIHAVYPADRTEVLYFKKTFDATDFTADAKTSPLNN